MTTSKLACWCGATLRPVPGLAGWDWRYNGAGIFARGGQREVGRAILHQNNHDVVVMVRRADGGVTTETSPGLCRGEGAT